MITQPRSILFWRELDLEAEEHLARQSSLIMGIVNVTPDSFSDGGHFLEPTAALDHAKRLVDEGAEIIDLGAESTRPGAKPVSVDDEWLRLEPILKNVHRLSAQVSVDTYKPEIMRRLLDYDVAIINDIRGGADDASLAAWAQAGRSYIAMHMHRDPQNMQIEPLEADAALQAVHSFYERTTQKLQGLGFASERIWLDPGIGFGKTDQANLYLIRDSLEKAKSLSLVLGISRKSFLGRLLGIEKAADRDSASKMLELNFLFAGVHAIRTHEVKSLRQLRDLLS